MKEMIKHHPLRPIVLHFDPEKTPPTFETEALAAYYRVHDRTYEIAKSLQEHRDELLVLDAFYADLNYELDRFALTLENVALPSTINTPIDKNSSAYKETARKGYQIKLLELKILWNKFDHYEPRFAQELTWHNTWSAHVYDHEGMLDGHSFSVLCEVYRRYKEVSVDICSLDQDDDTFRGVYRQINAISDTYIDHGNRVQDYYLQTVDRMENMWDRLKILLNGPSD